MRVPFIALWKAHFLEDSKSNLLPDQEQESEIWKSDLGVADATGSFE